MVTVETVQITISKDTKAILDDRAAFYGLSPSRYLESKVSTLLGGKIKKTPPESGSGHSFLLHALRSGSKTTNETIVAMEALGWKSSSHNKPAVVRAFASVLGRQRYITTVKGVFSLTDKGELWVKGNRVTGN